ncbi:MAG: hypothetical protein C4522_21795 [Desulfobacteraceae bacterium]|nr:MAG: hypothetical protein C4522_21795 [Desulfobacteraceae bacterium]
MSLKRRRSDSLDFQPTPKAKIWKESGMDEISQRVQQWIDEGKDPRSAHWQGGLEAILDVFRSSLEPGKLIPVHALEADDLPVFLSALEVVDLSPRLLAAFLPPVLADKVIPPESAEELQRIEKGKPSYKILIARPGREQRVLCAEISAAAKKPGVDIFQSGALLGTYLFENQQDCFAELHKIIRRHLRQKETWNQEDYRRYTVNWFEKTVDLRKGTVCVEEDFSFFHSPTLIRGNKIDAMFTLIAEMIQKRLNDPGDPLKESVSMVRTNTDEAVETVQLKDLLDTVVFDLLSVMKDCELFPFAEMTEKEAKQFNQESARTIQMLVQYARTL